MLIAQKEFLEEHIPEFHPATSLYKSYWKEQKRRCIEGYWQSGYWMPPKLYFYSNFATIKRKRFDNDKSQIFERPLLRDIEWIVFRDITVARGFSGFEFDDVFSCNELLLQELPIEDLPASCINVSGERKIYEDPISYLTRQHGSNLGRALYENEADNYILMGARGFGKDLHEDSILYLENTEVPIKDIKIGDRIYGADGKLTTVVQINKFDTLEQFEISFADGRKAICGEGHLWGVIDNKNQYKVLELKDIKENYLANPRKSGVQDSKYFIPIAKEIEYKVKDLPLDPYLLGFLIGDGGLTQHVTFTTADLECIEYLQKGLSDYSTCSIKKVSSAKYGYSITTDTKQENPLFKILKDLNLIGHTIDKHIPSMYQYGSIEQRMELLRGLMDTDGYISKAGNCEFTTISQQLSEDVCKLLGSLGIRYKVSIKIGSYKKDSIKINCNKVYRILILTSKPIFKLKRKLSRINTSLSKYALTNRSRVAIKSIRSIGIKPSVCIAVDNEDKLFLTNDHVVTHNSYIISSVIAHEFLFDGATDYIPGSTPPAVDIVVGAGHSNYSTDLLAKAKIILDKLPGEQELLGVVYPSPFAKKTTGSLAPSSIYQSKYKKRIGAKWKEAGSLSTIKHVSYADNPFAAQGGRNTIMVYEEVGMHSNILECYDASVENMRLNGRKFGTAIFLGTGGDMEGGGCCRIGTPVWDNQGNLHKIENLPLDSGILGFNQNSQQVSKENITYWQKPTEKPCYRIETNMGRHLECSDDHPILYSKTGNFRKTHRENKKRIYEKKVDWKATKDLIIGDQIAIADQVNIFSDKILEHARLIGLLIGDGSYGLQSTPSLSNCDIDINNYVYNNYTCYTTQEYLTKDGQLFKQTNIKQFVPILKALGLYGQVKQYKTLPIDIHSYSKHSICELIAGLFDSDGTINKDKISITFAHLSLIEELILLLQKLGIHGNIRKRQSRTSKLINGLNPYYCLDISDKRSVIRFHENIKLLSTKKQNKLNIAKELVEKKKDYWAKNLNGLRFETVTKVEYIGIHPVYNLTADTTNTYIANGIVTHNTIGAKEIFYNPGKYDALRFMDIYEMKGHIGRFIPAYFNLGEKYREDGWTDVEKSKAELLRRRKIKENQRGSEAALTKEIVNNPINPSEMFLAENSALLPAAEAARRLAELEQGNTYSLIEKVVTLFYDPDAKETNTVSYKIDSAGTQKPITKFPHKDNDREGAIIIYEFPAIIDGKVPHGAYVIGHDPYKDDNERGESLASIYVVKTAQYFDDIGHDEVVAEFVGRPYEGMNKVNDTLMKLSLFYGEAKIYFENAVGNTKDYFEKTKRLDLLATKPTALFTTTASYARSPTIEYGYPMSNQFIKRKGISYLRDWLLQPRGDDKRNIDLISSRALLQEIVFFSYEGNFDRVMGLMGAIFGLAQMSRELEDSINIPKKNNFANLDFIINNKKLFKNYATSILSSAEDSPKQEVSQW